MKLLIGCILIVCGLSFPIYAETIVFEGLPEIKISESGNDRVVENIRGDKAAEYRCVISEEGGKYYWKSRENKELILVPSGAFYTFLASNGSGYIRMIIPGAKEAASLMGDTEKKYDYTEHLLLGLKSITYYGKAK